MAESEQPTAEVIDFMERLAQGKIQEAEVPGDMEMTEYTFSNDKSNMAIRQLFHMLYQSVFANKLGVMHAKRKDDGKIDTVLVGMEHTAEGLISWPIARLLAEVEQENYAAPDGNGGYVE